MLSHENHSMGFHGGPYQSIFSESSKQQLPLGTTYREPATGRIFKYALAGEALTPGKLLATAALSGATTTLQTACSVSVAASAGDKRVYLTIVTTAQTADTFKGGWASINDVSTSPDDFYTIPITGNSALATTGTTGYIDLLYGVPVALTTSDKVDLTVNPWKSVIIQPVTTHTGSPVGVAPMNVTSGYYFWCQTWGPCAIMSNAGPLTVGAGVVSSTDIAGGVASQLAGSNSLATPQIGWCLNVSTDVYGALVYLTIAQ